MVSTTQARDSLDELRTLITLCGVRFTVRRTCAYLDVDSSSMTAAPDAAELVLNMFGRDGIEGCYFSGLGCYRIEFHTREARAEFCSCLHNTLASTGLERALIILVF